MAIPDLKSRPFFEDKNRAFWVLQSTGWTFYLMLRVASAVGSGMKASFLIPLIVSVATGYSLTLVLSAVFRWLISRTPIVTWTGAVTATLLAITIYSSIDAWVYNMLNSAAGTFDGSLFLASLTINFLLLAAWSALYFGINFYIILEQRADELLKLEGQASSAQLAMLRYQLNPHFLFNTLNSISTLVLLKQTERANAMLSRLSSFLRYTLVYEPTAQVTLAQEVETLKLYLDIEKMRFEERLRTSFDVDPAAAGVRLPSLLLQPLVENAVKYAVTPQEEGADISLEARLVGDRVRIVVSDSGQGLNGDVSSTTSSTGVGLANIRDRLVQAYGDQQMMEYGSKPDGGFAVTIELPFRREETV
jgi:LytS/YehU family sensor histidine kinase